LRRFPVAEGSRTSLGLRCEGLERGYYLARYRLKGSAFSAFFARKPAPVRLAVQADQNTPAGGPTLEAQATRWLDEYYSPQDRSARPDYIRPLVESVLAPWWTALPLVGAEAYQLEFGLSNAQDIWLLFEYGGEAGLQVEKVILYRIELSSPALGD
jgi:hypothetical protein